MFSSCLVAICFVSCSLYMYCCQPHPQVTEVVEPRQSATTAVILLHGAGESGPMMKELVESLIGSFSQFPETRFIFPTAMAVPFDPFPWLGQIINIWYNAEGRKLDTHENIEHMDKSAEQIMKWVEEQVDSGIPHNKICIGGFSAGGFMSMHFGYDYMKNIGCVGAIASFLSTKSALYKKLTSDREVIEKTLPPLYIAGGNLDFLIYPSWVQFTAETFRAGGVPVTYRPLWGKTHLLCNEALEGFFQFVQQTINMTRTQIKT